MFDDVVGIVPWLADLAAAADGGDVPPRLMTSAHPTATGTYGPAFVRWVDGQPQLHPRKTQGLLWWQRLVAYRALEHDADGALVWRNVLLTVSRQSGKSWLLRSLIAWRIAHADLFGELQQVLHVAHKLDAAAHVWEPAARWAQTQPGWSARWANGQERIEAPDGSRWLIQAATESAGVGFALSMALVDEAWRIARSIVDGAIDPTLAEAQSPQLWLVSTAGDAASDLFAAYRRMGAEQMWAPSSTLLVEWSAPPGADLDDPDVWRMASPRWTDRRHREVAEKRAKATDLEFRQQWVNMWVEAAGTRDVGQPLMPASTWSSAADTAFRADGVADSGAIESWFGQGYSASVAWRRDGVAHVATRTFTTLAEAVHFVERHQPNVRMCGKSLSVDPLVVGWVSMTTQSRQSVFALRRLVDEHHLRHDGDAALTDQVASTQVQMGADGPRVKPGARTDAIKAATWAATAALEAVPEPAIW